MFLEVHRAMTEATAGRDPREKITPDAFKVSDTLLGLPLAHPARRLGAILIDLAVIGLVTVLTRSFALVLGVLAAGFFIRVSFKRTEVRGSVRGLAMRSSLGCLGVFIGIVTAIVWAALGRQGDAPTAFVLETPAATESRLQPPGVGSVSQLLGGVTGLAAFRNAEDRDRAVATATRLAELGLGAGAGRSDLQQFLLEALPAEASWAAEAPGIVAEAIETAERRLGAEGGTSTASGGADAASGPFAGRPLPDLLGELSVVLQTEPVDGADSARAGALRSLVVAELGGDTLATLTARIARAEGEAAVRDRELAAARRSLEQEQRRGGFLSRALGLIDELGFGIGWASLYLTVSLSAWKGQTVGKRMMRIRVLRLDGQPITWWTAFERAGGYAAGFATGLLGFAQILWDANRQGIHDRIVGTVVVVDGAEPVPDGREQGAAVPAGEHAG